MHIPGHKLFLIPYEMDTYFVSFAQVTMNQYKLLKKRFNERKGMSRNEFQEILQNFLSENGTYLLKIFIISHKDNRTGDVVCIFRDKFLLPKEISLFRKDFESLYVLPCFKKSIRF